LDALQARLIWAVPPVVAVSPSGTEGGVVSTVAVAVVVPALIAVEYGTTKLASLE
jgi:hypothetical protein